MDVKRKQGLAPAAIVSSQNRSEAMVLKAVDLNRSLRHNSPFPAALKSFHKEDYVADQELQRFRSSISKENNQPSVNDHENNPYLTISCVRDSSMQRKGATKQQAEINQLDEELNELKQKNDIERIALQELEAVLIRRRTRVEKCRRLSEAQASYRSLLEKMIRDAMHQTIVYKEQLRLNHAASSALMARLETQRAACDSSENELRRKYKQRVELEIQAKACSEQAPKRSCIYDVCHENSSHLSSTRRVRRPTKKELRVFLEEEQKAFEAGISLSFDDQEESEEEESEETASITNEEEDHCQTSQANKIKEDITLNNKLKGFAIEEESLISYPGSSYNVKEGNSTILFSKDQDLTVNNKLKQIQHCEPNVIKTNESCKKISDQKKQTSYPCGSSYFVEGRDAILVSNKLKQVQNRGFDTIKTTESQNQWNLHLSSHEQQEENEEFQNLVGKGNVEKWLQILLENSKTPYTDSPYADSSYAYSHPTPRNFDEPAINTNTEIEQNEIELSTTNNEREKHCSEKMDSEKRFKEKSRVGTSNAWKVASRSRKSSEVEDREESKSSLPKCESSRGFISFPSSSPSVILAVRKSVERMRRRKPKVIDW